MLVAEEVTLGPSKQVRHPCKQLVPSTMGAIPGDDDRGETRGLVPCGGWLDRVVDFFDGSKSAWVCDTCQKPDPELTASLRRQVEADRAEKKRQDAAAAIQQRKNMGDHLRQQAGDLVLENEQHRTLIKVNEEKIERLLERARTFD